MPRCAALRTLQIGLGGGPQDDTRCLSQVCDGEFVAEHAVSEDVDFHKIENTSSRAPKPDWFWGEREELHIRALASGRKHRNLSRKDHLGEYDTEPG